MKELLRATALVQLSFLTAVLHDAGIEVVVFDNHMSVLEDGANAILRRLMVLKEDCAIAKRLLEDAGEPLDEC